ALEFSVRGAEQLDAAAAGRGTVVAQHEKRDCLRNQLFDTKTVTAFGWVERVKKCFKLSNQGDGVGAVGAFGRDDGCHRASCFLSFVPFRLRVALVYPFRSQLLN